MEPVHENSSSGSLSELFSECTPDEAAREFSPDRRSIRIHGHSTTIRLEKAFWEALEQLADQENMTVASLVTSVHDHCPQIDTRNLASCLRVVCLRTSRN
jgi:predicted DNA-binding ribbon-helix-helix protein